MAVAAKGRNSDYAVVKYRSQSLAEGVGSGGSEDGVVPPTASAGGGAQDGKLDVAAVLQTPGPSDLLALVEDGSADDGDSVGGGPVISGHLGVELADGSVERDVSVFLVHVVVPRSRLVPEDDAEGLDVVGPPLKNLID